MFTINVSQECGCFKKSDYTNGMSFKSKDDALLQGQLMTNHMNSNFCGKHDFELSEDGDNFTISVNSKQHVQHSGCCGGGHCS